jgi:hypothetical protein
MTATPLTPPEYRSPSRRERIQSLVAGVFIGVAVGLTAASMYGGIWWYLAIPVFAVLGWWVPGRSRPNVLWGHRGNMSAPPPHPDTSHWPTIVGQEVVEILYSASKLVRGIITKDSRGIYRVRTEFWDTGDWEIARVAYWCEEHVGTFTDTLENARQLCGEHMRLSRYAGIEP